MNAILYQALLNLILQLTPTLTLNVNYGTDISWPMHHGSVSTNFNTSASTPPYQPLGNRQGLYEHYLQGCYTFYNESEPCDDTEYDRIQMNLRQPQSMYNFSKGLGFLKIKTPPELMTILLDFYNNNKHDTSALEQWQLGNTYTNHWEAPSYMLSVENTSLVGGGTELRQRIWDLVESTISNWTGYQNLTTSSLYGIRVYKNQSLLAPHVDRLPLVSSAIINVDQDVDEPWPLEVIGHDGLAYNVTMDIGDMVLYESHSIIHGRPFKLQGNFYANLFIHFAPTNNEESAEDKNALPKYLIPHSPEHLYIEQRKENKQQKQEQEQQQKQQQQQEQLENSGATIAHFAASAGKIEVLEQIVAQKNYSPLFQRDINGWTPFHEAARSGHLHILKFLMQVAHNINGDAAVNFLLKEKTKYDETVLDVMKRNYEGENLMEIVDFLQNSHVANVDAS